MAWCWNLDTSTPVEVEVAELIGEILKNCTIHLGSVVANEEMCRKDASLGGCLTDQEEVVKCTSFVAYQVAVDNGTTRWVLDVYLTTIVLRCVLDVLLKESLVDSLVDHDQRDLGLR